MSVYFTALIYQVAKDAAEGVPDTFLGARLLADNEDPLDEVLLGVLVEDDVLILVDLTAVAVGILSMLVEPLPAGNE